MLRPEERGVGGVAVLSLQRLMWSLVRLSVRAVRVKMAERSPEHWERFDASDMQESHEVGSRCCKGGRTSVSPGHPLSFGAAAFASSNLGNQHLSSIRDSVPFSKPFRTCVFATP